jgi:hypothetical protein
MDNTGRWGWEDPPTPTALAEGGEGGYSLFPRPRRPPAAVQRCRYPYTAHDAHAVATADRSRQSGAGSCMSTSEPRTPDPRSPVSPVGMGMGMGVGMGILHCGLRGGLGGPLQVVTRASAVLQSPVESGVVRSWCIRLHLSGMR